MFLKTAGFKRLIKEAYKGTGLRIGNTERTLYLSGSYWIIEIMRGKIPKEKLAAIIELIGEIPEPGCAFEVTKDGQQYDLGWNDLYHAIDNARNCDYGLEVTKVIIEQRNGTETRILQNKETRTIYQINEKFIEMIDNGAIDPRSGHTEADGPVCGRLPGVFWSNNVMAMHVLPICDENSVRLIHHLEGIEINEKPVTLSKDESEEETEDT